MKQYYLLYLKMMNGEDVTEWEEKGYEEHIADVMFGGIA
jgi:hypothetical protein